MTLDEGHYYIYFFVVITYGKVSVWLWRSLENSGNFFLLLCGHPDNADLCTSMHDESFDILTLCLIMHFQQELERRRRRQQQQQQQW